MPFTLRFEHAAWREEENVCAVSNRFSVFSSRQLLMQIVLLVNPLPVWNGQTMTLFLVANSWISPLLKRCRNQRTIHLAYQLQKHWLDGSRFFSVPLPFSV